MTPAVKINQNEPKQSIKQKRKEDVVSFVAFVASWFALGAEVGGLGSTESIQTEERRDACPGGVGRGYGLARWRFVVWSPPPPPPTAALL